MSCSILLCELEQNYSMIHFAVFQHLEYLDLPLPTDFYEIVSVDKIDEYENGAVDKYHVYEV